MNKKVNFIPFFIPFFTLSIMILLLGSTGIFRDITSIINKSAQPAKDAIYILSLKNVQNNAIKELTEENQILKNKLAQENDLLNENTALRSQFERTGSESENILPAKVIGFPGFIPGVSLPDYLIIDKGLRSGVVKGNAIISSNFLVGRVTETYAEFSRIELITNKNSSFTGKVSGEKAINGVIKGRDGDEMVLDNVLLTEELKKGENVLTKGDKDERGNGYPPDILIGKIASIEKNQSDLFQRAEITSPVDFINLETVFVIKQ